MKLTLPDGTTIEGSPEELARLAPRPALAPVYVPFPLPAAAPAWPGGWWGIYPPQPFGPELPYLTVTCSSSEVRS